MRVTEHDPNLNYDLDDNMSAYFSVNSGNGLQSEYNYPDSMCGSANGDFISNRLVHKARARSPMGTKSSMISPRGGQGLHKQNSGVARLGSNERHSTTMKVSIDINKPKVANTMGVKLKAMGKFNKMKGLTQRMGNRSFNNGRIDGLKEGSPGRSDGKGQSREYSTNESDVRLSEILQQDNEEYVKNLEKKIEILLQQRTESDKKYQQVCDKLQAMKSQNETLASENKGLEAR